MLNEAANTKREKRLDQNDNNPVVKQRHPKFSTLSKRSSFNFQVFLYVVFDE